MTSSFNQWITDSDNDGIPDDTNVRFVVAPDPGEDCSRFQTLLTGIATALGQQVGALPLPLFFGPDDDIPAGIDVVTLTSVAQIEALADPFAPASTTETPFSTCLTHLFTINGMLADLDGDLLPDTIRARINLPPEVHPGLAAAVANVAARLGLESAPGSSIPADGPAFSIQPSESTATLESTQEGWQAAGNPEELAELLNLVSRQWPHITAPETGGAAYSLNLLRRWLAGDGPEPRPSGSLVWEEEWTAEWEIDRLRSAFQENLLQGLIPDQPLKLTIFASEPEAIRQRLAGEIRELLEDQEFTDIQIDTVCTFKAGLSWIREVVIPGLTGQTVGRIDIAYQRFDMNDDSLDRPTRWLQECFPGDEVLARELDIPLVAITFTEASEDGPTYQAVAYDHAGNELEQFDLTLLTTEWPFVEAITDSGTVQVTTSGITAEQPGTRIDLPVPSDLESFWTFWQSDITPRLLAHIEERGGAYRQSQPFFERLEIEVSISEPNNRLDIREENDSAAEALHEDIYFNTLDAIELYGRRQTGESCNAPGAVVPIVRVVEGEAPQATVRLVDAVEPADLPYPTLEVRRLKLAGDELRPGIEIIDPTPATVARLQELATLPSPDEPSFPVEITAGDVTVELRLPLQLVLISNVPLETLPTMHENIHGDAVSELAGRLAAFPEVTSWIEDRSYEDRPIPALSLALPTPGRLRSPTKMSLLKPTSLIVARHHANEISSTNAAFQLAWLVANDPEWKALLAKVNIVIIPYENPDGAALHALLTSDPEAMYWKHHPARYNALGYEFSQDMANPDTRFGESRVRPALWQRFLPDAIVDNHGVPSHEWVQPFAGFGSPPRFPVSYWIPQALLYGIVGYVESDDFPEHRAMAFALRDAVSEIVADTDIGDLNREIGRSYRAWGQERDPERFPGEFHNDMLWHIAGRPPDPEGRGFSARFPKTTILNWVTEVIDETATGNHLELTARAHLLANRAMLNLLAERFGRERSR